MKRYEIVKDDKLVAIFTEAQIRQIIELLEREEIQLYSSPPAEG